MYTIYEIIITDVYAYSVSGCIVDVHSVNCVSSVAIGIEEDIIGVGSASIYIDVIDD